MQFQICSKCGTEIRHPERGKCLCCGMLIEDMKRYEKTSSASERTVQPLKEAESVVPQKAAATKPAQSIPSSYAHTSDSDISKYHYKKTISTTDDAIELCELAVKLEDENSNYRNKQQPILSIQKQYKHACSRPKLAELKCEGSLYTFAWGAIYFLLFAFGLILLVWFLKDGVLNTIIDMFTDLFDLRLDKYLTIMIAVFVPSVIYVATKILIVYHNETNARMKTKKDLEKKKQYDANVRAALSGNIPYTKEIQENEIIIDDICRIINQHSQNRPLGKGTITNRYSLLYELKGGKDILGNYHEGKTLQQAVKEIWDRRDESERLDREFMRREHAAQREREAAEEHEHQLKRIADNTEALRREAEYQRFRQKLRDIDRSSHRLGR
ncbi:MAG: hypothetical protein IKI58_00255 [Oscillospiraceae bacterium]|nr:hypothetical protein [Oscillospiraceae bacterium]